jgi:hypothetical protein
MKNVPFIVASAIAGIIDLFIKNSVFMMAEMGTGAIKHDYTELFC